MDVELTPENPMNRLTARSAWSPSFQSLPELKPMFEETRRKGQAGVPTVIRSLRTLRENIKIENRARALAEQAGTRRKPDSDPQVQSMRIQAAERIETFIKENGLAPQMGELQSLRKRKREIEAALEDAGKYPADWIAESPDGFLARSNKELRAIGEKIWYIESSPEFQEEKLRQENAKQLAWEKTLEELSPEELELVNLDEEVAKIRENLQSLKKDGVWRQEAELDGSYQKMTDRLGLLEDLKDSPAYEAARKKALALYEKIRGQG